MDDALVLRWKMVSEVFTRLVLILVLMDDALVRLEQGEA